MVAPEYLLQLSFVPSRNIMSLPMKEILEELRQIEKLKEDWAGITLRQKQLVHKTTSMDSREQKG